MADHYQGICEPEIARPMRGKHGTSSRTDVSNGNVRLIEGLLVLDEGNLPSPSKKSLHRKPF